jgi:hypothetical protein
VVSRIPLQNDRFHNQHLKDANRVELASFLRVAVTEDDALVLWNNFDDGKGKRNQGE